MGNKGRGFNSLNKLDTDVDWGGVNQFFLVDVTILICKKLINEQDK